MTAPTNTLDGHLYRDAHAGSVVEGHHSRSGHRVVDTHVSNVAAGPTLLPSAIGSALPNARLSAAGSYSRASHRRHDAHGDGAGAGHYSAAASGSTRPMPSTPLPTDSRADHMEFALQTEDVGAGQATPWANLVALAKHSPPEGYIFRTGQLPCDTPGTTAGPEQAASTDHPRSDAHPLAVSAGLIFPAAQGGAAHQGGCGGGDLSSGNGHRSAGPQRLSAAAAPSSATPATIRPIPMGSVPGVADPQTGPAERGHGSGEDHSRTAALAGPISRRPAIVLAVPTVRLLACAVFGGAA